MGGLAQLGERLVCNQEVTGSSPVFSTSLRSLRELWLGGPAEAAPVALAKAGRESCRKGHVQRGPVGAARGIGPPLATTN